jgi:iron complex transport system ATP-binding protein
LPPSFPGEPMSDEGLFSGRMIDVAGLSYSVGASPILRDLSFAVEKNDFVLVFGQNGAGKSTLMKILSGIVAASGGRVSIAGKDVGLYSRRELATVLSYLPQADEFSLPILVKDVLLSGRYPYRSLFKKFSGHDRELFEKGIERFSLGGLLERNIQTLSGGERKKVLLATAFIQDVPLILLDEPLSSLDPGSTVGLKKMLVDLHGEGRTIVLVSHEIEHFFSQANKLLALKRGTKSYFGEKKFSRQLFQQVYDVSFQRAFIDGKEIIYLNE